MFAATQHVLMGDGLMQSPLYVPGVSLWLAGDQITGLSDGDPVGTWSDASGNGNNATQAVAAAKPVYKVNILNGKPVVRFAGVDDTLAMTDFIDLGTADHTLFIVATKTTEDGVFSTGFLEQQSDSTHRYVIWQVRLTPWTQNYYHNTGIGAGFAGSLGTFRVRTFRRNGTTSEHFANGGAGQSAVAADFVASGGGGINLGRTGGTLGAYVQGDMAEIILYNRALSNAEINRVNAYLSRKYGITVTAVS